MNRQLVTGGVFVALLLLCSIPGFASWQTACNQKRCQLYQQILNKKGDKPLSMLFFHLVPVGGDKAKGASSKRQIRAMLLLPLGLYIPNGVSVEIDKSMSFKANLIDCDVKEGCRATFEVQPATLGAIKRGGKIMVTIVDARSGQSIHFRFSLKGFTAAYTEFLRKS